MKKNPEGIKKNPRRLLRILLAAALVPALAGCGGQKEEEAVSGRKWKAPEETAAAAVEIPAAAVATPEPTPTPEPIPETSLSFVCVGDNLTHQKMINYGLALGGDWNYMYDAVRPYIQAADVAVVNQETVFVDDPAMYSGYPAFGTPYGVADAAVNAGFDIFTCATNHALDKDTYGIDTSITYYDTHGLFYVGIQSSAATDRVPYSIYEKNNIRCAILNYTYGTNGYPMPEVNPNMVHTFDDEALIRSDIAAAEADSDITIAFVHWGDEDLLKISDFQHYWTNVFYECGVDIVVGSHPHVVHPYEMISDGAGHDMLVYYSLGNFVSGQIELNEIIGGMATFTITKNNDGTHVTSYSMEPTVTHQTYEMRSQVFMLQDYDDYLCSLHWMDISMDLLWSTYNYNASW